MDNRTLALYEKCKEKNPDLSEKDFQKARVEALNKASTAPPPHMVFLHGALTPVLNGEERKEVFFANKEDDDED